MGNSNRDKVDEKTTSHTRILTGIFISIPVFFMMILGGPFISFMLLVAPVIIALEWSAMASGSRKDESDQRKTIVFAISVALVVFLAIFGALKETLFTLLFSVSMLFFLAFFQPTKALNGRFYLWPLGLIYTTLPYMAAAVLLNHFVNGIYLLSCLMALVFIGDIGAYYIGKKWGRTPLLFVAHISPMKSAEGAIAGIFFGTLGFIYFLVFSPLPNWLIVIAPFLCLLAQAGDWLESLVKRHFHHKNSGNLLPGHGGMMDRMDSFTIVVPVFVGFLILFGWPTVSQ